MLKSDRCAHILTDALVTLNTECGATGYLLYGLVDKRKLCHINRIYVPYKRNDYQGGRLFSKDGLHLNKRGAAVLGKCFLRAPGGGIGKLPLN